jgi:hypothetical protein
MARTAGIWIFSLGLGVLGMASTLVAAWQMDQWRHPQGTARNI